jgi:phosphatidylethanolamine-binding protein (PEBP) family uncharacterized protein
LVVVVEGAIILTSPEFKNGDPFPRDFGCAEASYFDRTKEELIGPSPPLFWTRVPALTQSFVLLLEDMDDGGKVLWLVKDLPRETREVAAGASGLFMPEGSVELVNTYGLASYVTPCPKNETHLYRFRLFAMRTVTSSITLPSDPKDLTAASVVEQLTEDTLYCAVITATYFASLPCPFHLPPGEDCSKYSKPTDEPALFHPDGLGIAAIRYVKPSESLHHHKYVPVKNTTILDSIVPKIPESIGCARNNDKERAQVVSAADPVFEPIRIPSANSIVEEMPMPPEEQLRRHIRYYTFGKVENQPQSLIQLQEQSQRSDSGLSSDQAARMADSVADSVAEGAMMGERDPDNEELDWGNVVDNGNEVLIPETPKYPY